jgi:hypothetical protein
VRPLAPRRLHSQGRVFSRKPSLAGTCRQTPASQSISTLRSSRVHDQADGHDRDSDCLGAWAECQEWYSAFLLHLLAVNSSEGGMV